MNELLGFTVLTGPLWLILVLLAVAIWLALMAARRSQRRSAKIAVGLLVFLLIFFVPFGDEIAGRIYLKHLCETKAGVRAYKMVELPAEYWDETGKPKFYDEKTGNFRLDGFRTEYQTARYFDFLHIDSFTSRRVDPTGQVLGEVISFHFWGGWARRSLSPHNTADGCEGERERSDRLISQIFARKKS